MEKYTKPQQEIKNYKSMIIAIQELAILEGYRLDFWSIDKAVTELILDCKDELNWSKYVNKQSASSMHDTLLEYNNPQDRELIELISFALPDILFEAKKFQMTNKMNAAQDIEMLRNRTIQVLTGGHNTPNQIGRGVELLNSNQHWEDSCKANYPENK
jgi:hypothetical protein